MIKLEAWLPRERNLKLDVWSHRYYVAYAYIALIHVSSDEVLAKAARDKFVGAVRVRVLPVGIMGRAVWKEYKVSIFLRSGAVPWKLTAKNGLVWATVKGKIVLVSFESQLVDLHRSGAYLFVDTSLNIETRHLLHSRGSNFQKTVHLKGRGAVEGGLHDSEMRTMGAGVSVSVSGPIATVLNLYDAESAVQC